MTPSCEAEKEDQRYFNSPPHKKNHIATTMINTVFFKISTHILTKRMTDGFPTFCILCVISTHILTKRMTQLMLIFQLLFTFQLTSSRRGWRYRCWFVYFTFFISTHILTKRMTAFRNGNLMESIFQLTSSRRGWRNVIHIHKCKGIFQLTSSRRGWQQF